MKRILLFLVLTLTPLSAFTQEKKGALAGDPKTKPIPASERCTKHFSDLPLFHQLRIGMNYDEVAEIYPEIKTDQHFQTRHAEDGVGLFVPESARSDNPSYQEAFEQLSVNIEKSVVRIIAVQYNAKKWDSLSDGVLDLSNYFGFSENNWTRYNEESAVANCADFDLYINSQLTGDRKQNSMSIHPKKTK